MEVKIQIPSWGFDFATGIYKFIKHYHPLRMSKAPKEFPISLWEEEKDKQIFSKFQAQLVQLLLGLLFKLVI